MTEDDARTNQLADLQLAVAGTWSIERELGRGGMGTVYLARDVALDRPVAIKVLAPELAGDPGQRSRFLHEARTGARLSHPNIVPTYAVEEAAGTVFIVMGLVEGESIADRLHRAGPLTQVEALNLLRDVSWALGYAHAKGTLHRDVTLDNILIEKATGRGMLVDFGIAAQVGDDDAGRLVGTAAYLAPELIHGEPATPQSDLYALAITAWAMLAGRLPFHADDTPALLLQHVTTPVPSLESAAPATSTRLARAIEGALAKNPAERPASIEAWQGGFERLSVEIAADGPLLKWIQQWDQVKAFYALGMSIAMLLAFSNNVSFVVTLAVSAVILVAHRAISLRLFRGALGAGYTIEDLRLGLARQVKSMTNRLNETQSRLHSALDGVRRIGLVLLLIILLLETFQIPWSFQYKRFVLSINYFVLEEFARYGIAAICTAAIAGSLSLRAILPGRPTWLGVQIQRARLWFWNSTFGTLRFRFAIHGRRQVGAPEMTLHRPTELVLDLAIEELWRELPAETRRASPGLQDIVKALRKRVAESRDVLQLLDQNSDRISPEILDIRTRLIARQQEGIAALERLRLLLGQLGGAAAPLMSSELTHELQMVREANGDLLAELGVHERLRRLTWRHRISTPSPTPSLT